MNIEKEKIGSIVILLILLSGIFGVLMLDPIAQDLEYHLFKDQKTIFGIPNFWNVVSSLLFLFAGIIGLHRILRSNRITIIHEMKAAYILFFLAASLVGFGSVYYHLWPSNGTLAWDRLPMTIGFMALFSIIIAEFISFKLGKFVLWPLVIFGVFSIFYWYNTESNGEGDLRLYILVQFLPMIVIPLILLFYKSKFTCTSGYWLLLCAYALAKAFEHFDEAIYNLPLLLSGHSLKHIVAALGILFLLNAYKKRKQT